MNIPVIWDVMLCLSVSSCQHFDVRMTSLIGWSCLTLKMKACLTLQNVGKTDLPTESHPRKVESTATPLWKSHMAQ